MKTKIFISWSGKKSMGVANVLKKWIPILVSNVDAFVSNADIMKGTRPLDKISSELKDTSYGIVCLMKENIASPWIYFEAGAISKLVNDTRLMPILFDLESSDISSGNPILQFQYSKFERSEMLKCINSINSCCGEHAIDKSNLEIAFESFWPIIKKEVEDSMSANSINSEEKDESEVKTDRHVLEEILLEVRNQSSRISHRPSSSRINPRAAKDLLESYNNMFELQSGYYVLPEEEFLEKLTFNVKALSKPVRYLVEGAGLKMVYEFDKLRHNIEVPSHIFDNDSTSIDEN